jgi:antitoxin component HigA of HigAB toxin-antitoxin module
LPGRYEDLVSVMPPRAIVDDVHLDNTIEMIERLMDIAKPTKGQAAYLDTLVQLTQVYEAEHHAIDVSDICGVDSLKYVMDMSGTSAVDVAKLLGVHVTLVYKILSGERSLTVEHMKILAKHFRVRADVFM